MKSILHKKNLTTFKNKLNAKQKESLFLLSIGTFLECFDLFLYMHMAVLLNVLFFPQADPLIAKLLAAVAFCSTYVFMPIGGFVIGWIGDHVGRKNTIIITTFIMALCCFAMANVEIYSDIGILATWIVLICRMLQGFSSFGETVGPQLYLAETLKQPLNYFAAGIITLSARLGGLFALAVAASSSANWRVAFYTGTIIATIGIAARTRLRAAQEFTNFKLRIFKKKEKLSDRLVGHKLDLAIEVEPCHVNKATVLSYFIIQFNLSVGFYIVYIYAGSFMQDKLGMTPEQVIAQNLKLTFVLVIVTAMIIFFVRKYHPLKIARLQIIALGVLLPFLPYWLSHTDLVSLSLFQFVAYLTALAPFCMEISCFKHIPIEKRFAILSTTFGLGTALGNIVATIGIIALTSYFGYYGILVIMVPVTICVFCAVSHIRKLEIKEGLYHNYPGITYTDEAEKAASSISEEDEAFLNCEYSKFLLDKLDEEEQKQRKKINRKLIEKAIVFAKKYHGNQLRKTGEPFYSHPLAVASIVSSFKLGSNIICGAILHDIVEDTDCSLEIIKKEFNPEIAELVRLATRISNNVKIKLSIKSLFNNIRASYNPDAMLIKCCDRLHNLMTAHGLNKAKQIALVIETLESVLPSVAYGVDKCNVNDKLRLEEEIFKQCEKIIELNNEAV
jgi:MFS family permease